MKKIILSKDLLKSSEVERINAVAQLATDLKLGNAIVIQDLHKAHKGERISQPHLNPMIWELEKQFFSLFNPQQIIKQVMDDIAGRGMLKSLASIMNMNKSVKPLKVYNSKGEALTKSELKRLEEILSNALHVPIDKVREIILKSALVGKMAGAEMMGEAITFSIKNLPRTLQDAIKTAGLTVKEVRAIKFAWNYAAINIANVQNRAKGLIKQQIINGLMNRTPPRALANQMFNKLGAGDDSLLNRDWERVAITETNRSANDGFIAGKANGEYVIGNSHPDACPYCMKLIHHKIYRVTTHPPKDYSDLGPKSKGYQSLAKRWENEIWVGKSNINRSLATRKRVGGKLIPRGHHEMAAATIPLHPTCLVGNSLVSPRGDIMSVYKRKYTGEIITIKCSNGRELTATPNHPILTPKGWILSGNIRINDYVICNRHEKDKSKPISEIVDEYQSVGYTKSFNQKSSMFHGDGMEGAEILITSFYDGYKFDDRIIFEGKREKIVGITTKTYSGYVYNIETTESYYIANGITVHNCRCRWTSWIPGLYYIKDGRVEFAVDEKSKAEHAQFLKMNPRIVGGGKQ